MFRFENPLVLRYLILLLVIAGLWLWQQVWGRRQLNKVLGSRSAPFLMASVSNKKRKLKLLFRLFAAALAIVALARPQAGQSKEEIKSQGVEIIFLVDVSESMMSEDVRPSRLEQVKSELGKLVDDLPGNKMGIVAFAGSATVLAPITNDPNSLHLYIDSLSPLSVSTQGTDFQRALVEARDAFKRGSVATDKDSPVRTNRVVIMLSDGEDHEDGALSEAQNLAKDGIRIFALAYGTEKGAPIPDRDSNGFLRGYKKDQSGQVVLSQVHGDALRELASAGKGSFYHAAPGGDHLHKVIEDLNQLEKTDFESQIATQYEEKFQTFLLIGILFLLTDMLLSDRRRQFQLWTGRFEVPLR